MELPSRPKRHTSTPKRLTSSPKQTPKRTPKLTNAERCCLRRERIAADPELLRKQREEDKLRAMRNRQNQMTPEQKEKHRQRQRRYE